MATKKRKGTRYVYLKNGKKYRILRQDGKYLYCDGITLMHINPTIDRIDVEYNEPEAKKGETTDGN